MALTAGITVDYHLDEDKCATSGLVKSAIFVFTPMVVTIFVVLAYLMSRRTLDARQSEIFVTLNIVALALGCAYAAGAKIYLFYRPNS
jgi:hypothetical protein